MKLAILFFSYIDNFSYNEAQSKQKELSGKKTIVLSC